MPKKPQPTTVSPFGAPQDGYYKITVDRAGNPRREEGRVAHTRADLPAPRQGKEWTEYKNVDGEIYFVEQSSAYGDDARKKKAEQDKRDAEAAAERQRQAAEEAAKPPERPVFEPGTESGLSHMRELIEHHRKKLSDVFGFTLKVKDGLGNSRTIVELGDVSTSVKGTNVGPVTLGPDGKPVAVKVGGATVTEDGRVIAGRGVKIGRFGAGVDAKAAADVGNVAVGGATEFTEGVVDEAVKRVPGIGGTSADGGG